jgi:hypothetical protein
MTTVSVENSGPWADYSDVIRTKSIFGTSLVPLQEHAAFPNAKLVQPFAKQHPTLIMSLPAVYTSLTKECCLTGIECAGELVDLAEHMSTDEFRPFAADLPADWMCTYCHAPHLRPSTGKRTFYTSFYLIVHYLPMS